MPSKRAPASAVDQHQQAGRQAARPDAPDRQIRRRQSAAAAPSFTRPGCFPAVDIDAASAERETPGAADACQPTGLQAAMQQIQYTRPDDCLLYTYSRPREIARSRCAHGPWPGLSAHAGVSTAHRLCMRARERPCRDGHGLRRKSGPRPVRAQLLPAVPVCLTQYKRPRRRYSGKASRVILFAQRAVCKSNGPSSPPTGHTIAILKPLCFPYLAALRALPA